MASELEELGTEVLQMSDMDIEDQKKHVRAPKEHIETQTMPDSKTTVSPEPKKGRNDKDTGKHSGKALFQDISLTRENRKQVMPEGHTTVSPKPTVVQNEVATGTLLATAVINKPILMNDTQKAPPSTMASEQMEEQISAQASLDNSHAKTQVATSMEQTATKSIAETSIPNTMTDEANVGSVSTKKMSTTRNHSTKGGN